MNSPASYTARQRLYYAILSGEHPTLPRGEFEALLESAGVEADSVYQIDTLVLFRAGLRRSVLEELCRKSAYIREVGESVALAPEEPGGILEALKSAEIPEDQRYWIVYEKHGVPDWDPGYNTVIREAAEALRGRLSRDGSILKIDHYPGFIHVGVRYLRRRYSDFQARSPRRRPVFRPGTLDPRLSRALVNLSRPRPGLSYLDPFCGVGGLAIEAALLGLDPVVCGDVEYKMMRGAELNLAYYSPVKHGYILYYGDAARMPFRDESIDRISTDPPYGRSTSTKGRSISRLLEGFLYESYRILRRRGVIVFASPVEAEPGERASEAGFRVIGYHEMHVHGGLVRSIVVAVKP